jgi:hypothetical protein
MWVRSRFTAFRYRLEFKLCVISQLLSDTHALQWTPDEQPGLVQYGCKGLGVLFARVYLNSDRS